MYDCARSAITFNNLNLPSYDVHSREARDQMLVNLYTLQQSFVKINNKITQKTKQQNQRIQQLRDRILQCKSKIEALQGVNKAISFVSPGQYPTKYKFDPEKNVSIFKDYMERTPTNKFDLNAHYQMKHQVEQIGDRSKLQINNLHQFILFLYGKLKCKKMTILEKGILGKHVKGQTLGKIPTCIKYVDSLTVFDTHINPYKKYEIAQKPKPKQKTNPKVSNHSQVGLVDIQVTITSYNKPIYDPQNPNYRPTRKEAPQIVFNDDLGLTGIVQLDVDDFLSGMPSNFSDPVPRNVVSDPYKGQQQQAIQNPYANNSTLNTSQHSNSLPTNTSNLSSSLPPPPPPNISSSSYLPPPPPPSLPNLLPPPPSLPNLLPPPPSNLPAPPGLPAIGNLLPPPSLPSLGNPSQNNAPAMPSGGAVGRGDLLKQLNNPNPMGRLKKVNTRQSVPLAHLAPQSDNPAQDNQNPPSGPPRALSHMEALQLKIKNRFKALHPERQDVKEEEQSDQE